MTESGYISGKTTLRPIRMGMVVPENSLSAILDAVGLATSTWGGMSFPIFQVGADNIPTPRHASALGVDALFAVASDEESKNFAEQPGFRWAPSIGVDSPFDRKETSRGEHLLASSSLFDWYKRSRQSESPASLLTWDDADPLAALLTTWYGDTSKSGDPEAFSSFAVRMHIDVGTELPNFSTHSINQLSITMEDVRQYSRWYRYGVVVLDHTSPRDLSFFWNLRAIGHDVFPWSASFADRFETSLKDWIGEYASIRGIRGERRLPFTIWYEGEQALPAALSTLLSEYNLEHEFGEFDFSEVECAQLTTEHEKTFSTNVARGAGSADISVPILDFLPRRTVRKHLGYVAADVTIWTESNLGEGVSAHIPAARPATDWIQGYWSAFSPFVRPTPRGRVVPVQVDEETIRLVFFNAVGIIERLFESAGFRPRSSETALRFRHRMSLFGGCGVDSLANQPSVREVMRKAIKSKGSVSAKTLLGIAGQNGGEWGQQSLLHRQYSAEYANDVLAKLSSLGVLHSLANFSCKRCGSTIRVAPVDLGKEIHCELCNDTSQLDLYVAAHPTKPMTWDLSPMISLTLEEFHELLPVMSTLSVFSACFGDSYSGRIPLGLAGLELTRGDLQCELDLVVFTQDGDLPVVIIGESKAGHPSTPAERDLLTEDDVSHLRTVQDAVRAIGIDCWIVFSTTRQNLEQSEVELLKALCNDMKETLNSDMNQKIPVLPIVFVGSDLSLPFGNDSHPIARVRYSSPRIRELGFDTCKRQLGLVSIDYKSEDGDVFVPRPIWPNEEVNSSTGIGDAQDDPGSNDVEEELEE